MRSARLRFWREASSPPERCRPQTATLGSRSAEQHRPQSRLPHLSSRRPGVCTWHNRRADSLCSKSTLRASESPCFAARSSSGVERFKLQAAPWTRQSFVKVQSAVVVCILDALGSSLCRQVPADLGSSSARRSCGRCPSRLPPNWDFPRKPAWVPADACCRQGQN